MRGTHLAHKAGVNPSVETICHAHIQAPGKSSTGNIPKEVVNSGASCWISISKLGEKYVLGVDAVRGTPSLAPRASPSRLNPMEQRTLSYSYVNESRCRSGRSSL